MVSARGVSGARRRRACGAIETTTRSHCASFALALAVFVRSRLACACARCMFVGVGGGNVDTIMVVVVVVDDGMNSICNVQHYEWALLLLDNDGLCGVASASLRNLNLSGGSHSNHKTLPNHLSHWWARGYLATLVV